MKAALAASTTWWGAGRTAVSAPGRSVVTIPLTAVVAAITRSAAATIPLTAVVAAITRSAAAAVVARAGHNSSGVRGRPMEKFCTRPSGL